MTSMDRWSEMRACRACQVDLVFMVSEQRVRSGEVNCWLCWGGFRVKFQEWRLPNFLYADDLVLCGQSEEDLRAVMEHFAEVCRRKGLKVNASKSKVMGLNGEEGLECDVLVHCMQLEHVS